MRGDLRNVRCLSWKEEEEAEGDCARIRIRNSCRNDVLDVDKCRTEEGGRERMNFLS